MKKALTAIIAIVAIAAAAWFGYKMAKPYLGSPAPAGEMGDPMMNPGMPPAGEQPPAAPAEPAPAEGAAPAEPAPAADTTAQ